jgi:hypothetical protein
MALKEAQKFFDYGKFMLVIGDGSHTAALNSWVKDLNQIWFGFIK